MLPTNTPVDKAFKHGLRELLLSSVYTLWYTRLQDRMDELISRNNVLNNTSYVCLRLRGRLHWMSGMGVTSHEEYTPNKLHPSLASEAHAWLIDFNEIHNEELSVSHSLSSVLSVSNHMDDYKEMLPESLHSVLDGYTGIIPDQATTPRAPAAAVARMKIQQAPHLAPMGQRFVLSLIL